MNLKSYSNKIVPIILAAGRGSRMGALTTNFLNLLLKLVQKKID